VIAIEPTDPNTMYVPYYEPAVVYGDWPYPDYPAYYFGVPPYIGAGVIAAGIAFGAGLALGRWSNYWRGGCNWGNNNFFINRTHNIGNNWQHNPAHRQGVRYDNAGVQQRFGNNNLRAGSADRMDFRGRGGEQVLNPGKDRAGAGDRSGGDRAATRDRLGDDRQGGTERRAGDTRVQANRLAPVTGVQASRRARAIGAQPNRQAQVLGVQARVGTTALSRCNRAGPQISSPHEVGQVTQALESRADRFPPVPDFAAEVAEAEGFEVVVAAVDGAPISC
jgi:hypothetical protein